MSAILAVAFFLSTLTDATLEASLAVVMAHVARERGQRQVGQAVDRPGLPRRGQLRSGAHTQPVRSQGPRVYAHGGEPGKPPGHGLRLPLSGETHLHQDRSFRDAAAGARLPVRLRVHLLPAETEAKDDVLRFTEVEAEPSGTFSFEHLAPGKYLLLTRAVPENESPDKPKRPIAWDAAERAKLRKEAETANALVELKTCQRVTDFVLAWK